MAQAATLQAIVEEEAIRDLMTRYFTSVDRKDFAAVGACFTEDAFVDFEGATATGTEAILKFIRGIEPAPVLRHFMGNQRIDLRGETAEVETYAIAMVRQAHDGRVVDNTSHNRYVDRMVKRGGRWLVAHRLMLHDWRRHIPVSGPT